MHRECEREASMNALLHLDAFHAVVAELFAKKGTHPVDDMRQHLLRVMSFTAGTKEEEIVQTRANRTAFISRMRDAGMVHNS